MYNVKFYEDIMLSTVYFITCSGQLKIEILSAQNASATPCSYREALLPS